MTDEPIRPRGLARAAEQLPKRRILMMGSGRAAQPKRVEGFCDTIVSDCLDGRFCARADMDGAGTCCEEFALGFAACLDAVSRGTIDFDEHPRNVVNQAWRDVSNVTTLPNSVTDVMGSGRGR